ncbi:hypothetical protein NQ315_012208 [Exocentrus adspersus]|uniref:Neurotransmitter-gated ion-channel ligand-binding domain-containing protein n=1 Tax=Exocentrus adspersus TaxID=1586481 RepID=A0AAV8VZK0_9CUCU|nr:hypothetical protein NQ315_012208 [Exocentrus adspersus]
MVIDDLRIAADTATGFNIRNLAYRGLTASADFKAIFGIKCYFLLFTESIQTMMNRDFYSERCSGNPDAKRLYDDLLSNYNKLVRPVVNVTDALTVKIKLKLSQLIDVLTETRSTLQQTKQKSL